MFRRLNEYIRYEMPEKVKNALFACVLLLFPAVEGGITVCYLHELDKKQKEQEEAETVRKKLHGLIENLQMPRHPSIGHFIYTPEPKFVFDEAGYYEIMTEIALDGQ